MLVVDKEGWNYKGSESHVVNIKISLSGGENHWRILNKDVTMMRFTWWVSLQDVMTEGLRYQEPGRQLLAVQARYGDEIVD